MSVSIIFLLILIPLILGIPIMIAIYVYRDAGKRHERGSLDVDCPFDPISSGTDYLSVSAQQLFGLKMSKVRHSDRGILCSLPNLPN